MMCDKAVRITIIIVLLQAFAGNITAKPAANDYDYEQARKFAVYLLKEQRNREVVAYLREALTKIPQDDSRVPLLLLLARGYIGSGDQEKAKLVLKELKRYKLDKSQDRELESLLILYASVADRIPGSQVEVSVDSTADTLPVSRTARFQDVRITNSFYDADIRLVLAELSLDGGVPILWDPTVEGVITYEAVDSPLESILDALLLPLGFTWSFHDGTCFVGSSSPDQPAFAMLSITEFVTLSNVNADEALRAFSDFFQPYMKSIPSTNTICITAPPKIADRIKRDLISCDKEPSQISIEVIVAEISSSALRKIGVDWSLFDAFSDDNPQDWSVGLGENTNMDPTSIVGSFSETGKEILSTRTDLLVNLEALIQTGEAKIRANPRITTMNGHTASIHLTKDQYFIIQTSSSQYYSQNTLEAISSGISLEFTPFVSASDRITLRVAPEVGDVIGSNSEDLPEINTRSAETSIIVSDGETFSIGGLSLEYMDNIKRKVPILGSIPLLGYLFRYEEHRKRETEVVIFVTPRIVKGDS